MNAPGAALSAVLVGAVALIAAGLGASIATPVIVAAAAIGLPTLLRYRRDGSNWPREWKVWAFALILYVVAAGSVEHLSDPFVLWLSVAWIALVFVPASMVALRARAWTFFAALGIAIAAWINSEVGVGPELLPPMLNWTTHCLDPALNWDFLGACNGVPGIAALLVLGLVPAVRFGKALAHPAASVRWLAGAGIAVVLAAVISTFWNSLGLSSAALLLYATAISLLYGVLTNAAEAWYVTPVRRGVTLSATLICKNEADRIRPCLDSLKGWVDEIIVLDSGSADATVQIAREYTSHVFVTDWPGFGVQKQRALERASCDWVLSIDADEALTPELRHDIDFALRTDPPQVGFRLPWAVIAYGRQLDFGRSARAPLRVFRRAGARFTADIVHERVELPPGPVITLRGRLLHYTLRDYGHALRKSADYAWLGAQQRMQRKRRGGGLVIALLRSLVTFLQIYFVRGGLLDGRVGLLVAVTYAQGSFNKYAGLWTLRQAAQRAARH